MSFSRNYKLWVGAAFIFASAIAVKQTVWKEFSRNLTNKRDLDHQKATLALANSYKQAQKYNISSSNSRKEQDKKTTVN